MPRRARLRLDGFPLHIVQRGHNKGPCFFAPRDYELYLGLLGEYAPKSGCRIHAYVLMTNHVHLLLSADDGWGATRLMRHVNQHYVQYVNRVHHRCGTAWQGRFWSSIVDTNSYFLTCQRYVELNPQRAGMVNGPGDYPWSSHNHNAHGQPSLVVTPHECYLSLGSNERARQMVYRGLFAQPIEEGDLGRIREATRGGRPLGSDEFLDELEARFGVSVRRRKPGPHKKE